MWVGCFCWHGCSLSWLSKHRGKRLWWHTSTDLCSPLCSLPCLPGLQVQ
jgi:hypothetical protein